MKIISPFFGPADVGVNVIRNRIEFPAATTPEVGCTVNWLLVDTTEATSRVSFPAFTTRTLSRRLAFTTTFPNPTLPGATENEGAEPIPPTVTFVGEPAASCVKVILPPIFPTMLGENVTKNLRLAVGLMVAAPGVTLN